MLVRSGNFATGIREESVTRLDLAIAGKIVRVNQNPILRRIDLQKLHVRR